MDHGDWLSLKEADALAEATLAAARRNGLNPVAVSILDQAGAVVVSKRETGAAMIRPLTAEAKAWTALALGNSSRDLQDIAAERSAFAASLNGLTAGRMIPSAGGLLIKRGESTIGAIGVSGDLPENDEWAAQEALSMMYVTTSRVSQP